MIKIRSIGQVIIAFVLVAFATAACVAIAFGAERGPRWNPLKGAAESGPDEISFASVKQVSRLTG